MKVTVATTAAGDDDDDDYDDDDDDNDLCSVCSGVSSCQIQHVRQGMRVHGRRTLGPVPHPLFWW